MTKHTHFRTPRTMNDAWGPYSTFSARKKESVWWYVAACAVTVAIVFIACYRG
jgi:hypothetical protein